MKKSGTPSFVCSVELLPDSHAVRLLTKRFEAARQLYNAILGESKKRVRLMQQSKTYKAALAANKEYQFVKGYAKRLESNAKIDPAIKLKVEVAKAAATAARKHKKELFKTIEKAVGLYGDYALNECALEAKAGWIAGHLSGQSREGIAKRVLQTIRRWTLGRGGEPRFKTFQEGLGSIDVRRDCKWTGDGIRWMGVVAKAKIDPDDVVIQHGLRHRVKYVRVQRLVIRGKERWFAQLVCEGVAYQKYKAGKGAVGLDVNVQCLAAIGEGSAFLVRFCSELDLRIDEIASVQQKIDELLRLHNPDNYNKNGQRIKGQKWRVTQHVHRLLLRLAELHRKNAAHRKNLHGQLVRRVLAMGDHIKTESVSIKDWQKRFGKSIGYRAPSMFQELLHKAAVKCGAIVEEFSTWTTALSSTCHCGRKQKKDLSKDHNCPCGVAMQRDLYTAFLAQFVEADRLDKAKAKDAWPKQQSILLEAARIGWEKRTPLRSYMKRPENAAEGQGACSHRDPARTERIETASQQPMRLRML